METLFLLSVTLVLLASILLNVTTGWRLATSGSIIAFGVTVATFMPVGRIAWKWDPSWIPGCSFCRPTEAPIPSGVDEFTRLADQTI